MACLPHRIGDNRKCSLQSTNADQKSLETVFSIAICRPSGDKWQSKTLFILIFDLRSSLLLFSIATYPVCLQFPDLDLGSEMLHCLDNFISRTSEDRSTDPRGPTTMVFKTDH